MSSSPSTFSYDPAVGAAGMASFALVDERHERTALEGSKLQMGLMTLLLDAELLAADAELVPWVQLPDGGKGVVTIGAARDVIDRAPLDVRTMYLAAHGVARRAHNEAQDVTRSGSAMGNVQLLMSDQGIGLLPFVVPLVVLGVAAIIGAAYYATTVGEKMVQTKSTELKYAAKLDALQKLAGPIVAAGQPLPESFWREFGDFSEKEAARAMLPLYWGAAAAVAAGGLLWVWTSGGFRSVRA